MDHKVIFIRHGIRGVKLPSGKESLSDDPSYLPILGTRKNLTWTYV